MAAEDKINASKERLSAMLEPISGGVGADITYDEAFEAMKAEVEKMTSLAGGKTDWGSIASSADEILSDKSKDFRVAIYYAAAKTHLDGLDGLLDGLVLMQGLIAAFWEPMYPPLKRPKARGALMGWYSDASAPAIAGYSPTSKDKDIATAIDEVSKSVDGDLRDKLSDAYSGMGALRTAIRNLVQSVPAEAPPPPPPPPPPPKPEPGAEPVAAAEAPAPAAPAGPSAASITDADSANAALEQVALIVARAGDALRTAEPTSATGYRLIRAGIWLQVNQPPYAPDGAQTLLPGPADHLKTAIGNLSSAGNWEVLLQATEEAAAENLFWLDLQRHAATALENLGEAYAEVRRAVVGELALLISRVPTLPTFTFSDGTPFADPDTVAWIDGEVKKSGGGGGGGGAPAGPRSVLDKPLAEARALATAGELPAAIALASRAVAAAPSAIDRFKGRLAIGKMCLEASQFMIARAQLDGLDRLVEHHRLHEWDPALCADLYAALVAAHRGANQGDVSPEIRARENAAFEKLCQLDTGAALRLSV